MIEFELVHFHARKNGLDDVDVFFEFLVGIAGALVLPVELPDNFKEEAKDRLWNERIVFSDCEVFCASFARVAKKSFADV